MKQPSADENMIVLLSKTFAGILNLMVVSLANLNILLVQILLPLIPS